MDLAELIFIRGEIRCELFDTQILAPLHFPPFFSSLSFPYYCDLSLLRMVSAFQNKGTLTFWPSDLGFFSFTLPRGSKGKKGGGSKVDLRKYPFISDGQKFTITCDYRTRKRHVSAREAGRRGSLFWAALEGKTVRKVWVCAWVEGRMALHVAFFFFFLKR